MTTKAQEDRAIDWSIVRVPDRDAALRNAICRYVGGYRKPRVVPVTKEQIKHNFMRTPPDMIERALLDLITSGKMTISARSLSSSRRATGVYVYEIAEREEA
jgi:hypothetical protein